jgi:hypothetical protein
MRPLVLAVTVLLAACGPAERDLTGEHPLAVGASAAFQVTPCDDCTRRFDAVSGAAADDPSIVEVESLERDRIRLRGVAPGRARLLVNGRSSSGQERVEYVVEVAAPQVIAAAVSCRDSQASTGGVPLLGVGTPVPLILAVARNGRSLRGEVRWRIEPGPDFIVDHGTDAPLPEYKPEAPGRISVAAELDGLTHATFQAYGVSEVDGLYLFTGYQQPQRAQSCFEICILPRVGGRAACTDIGASRTATITTPLVCRFNNLQGPLTRTSGLNECPSVCGSAAGTCRMEFQLDGMTATGSGEVRFQ